MNQPGLFDVEIGHTRFVPFRRSFQHKGNYWLVDVDDLPRLPRPLSTLVGFESRDHFDDPSETIRFNATRLLADHGIELDGGRILMLASPRSLGHVFNPISLFWCYDSGGVLQAVIAEVHNTYGQRHNYVLRTDAAGRAGMEKDFYVSPFITVEGEYRVHAPEPDERLRVSITLVQDGDQVFTAWVTGERRPLTTANALRALTRHPLGTIRVSALIRRHGVALWMRRLPVVPRGEARSKRKVQAAA